MMASLRARLIAGLLALAAVGMLLLAGITYLEQRSFLLERVDQQARSATIAVAGALDERGVPGGPPEVAERRGPPLGAPPPGGGAGVGLPPGTFGQRRDANGRVLGEVVFSYGQEMTARPALSAELPSGRLVTVEAEGGGGPRYRALAEPDPFDGSLTVVAVPLAEVEQTLERLLVVEALVIAGVLVLLGLLAWFVVRMGLLPLDRMAHTAGAIAGGDLSQRVEATDPRTEVGRLGIALNAMLDRLEHAFAERRASEERLRRVIADASHELPTPPAAIRGYAEVFRMGAVRDPADRERAMRRIEDEAARMGVLVEDLLTLARLGEVAEAPHDEVDLAALARDAVEDARATAPDRPIDIHVQAGATVLGDAHQLRQVLGNLLRNALVHTPAGTPIEVRVAGAGGDIRLEVRDHGPGLPTEDGAALFERFWRAERGRERGRGGAGLGLAIVAGIVAAHGGRVEASNALGGGASFVVHLPAATASRPAEAPSAAL